MKGKYLNLIISLQLAGLLVELPESKATLRINTQVFQLLSQGHSGRQGISYGAGRRQMDGFLAFMFSEAMDVIHLPAVSLCVNCWGFLKVIFP